MITLGIISIILQSIFLVSSGIFLQKNKGKPQVYIPLFLAGLFFTGISLNSVIVINYREDAVKRLKPPVVSHEQLYGYQVFAKRSFKTTEQPSGIYSIDIRDISNLDSIFGLRNTIFKNIPVSHGFYNQIIEETEKPLRNPNS